MSVAFQLPQATSIQSKVTGQSGNFGLTGEGYADTNKMNALFEFDQLKTVSTVKSLDLSSTYGVGTTNNPLKKFHQISMYFNPNIRIGTEKQEGSNTEGRRLNTQYIITSNLPDNLSYKVGGQWNKPLDWTADATIDLIVRAATKEKSSLKTMASTGLMWTCPEPLEITFTIHAFDDTSDSTKGKNKTGSLGTNIQECLRILGTYALPDEGQGVYRNVPSGVDLGVTIKRKSQVVGQDRNIYIGKNSENKDTSAKWLNILIGGMLYIEHMSIKGFTVNYTNTKNMLLHHWSTSQTSEEGSGQRLLPMTADITITLTTVRGLSRLNYNKMLMLPSKYDSDKSIRGQTADESIFGEIDLTDLDI